MMVGVWVKLVKVVVYFFIIDIVDEDIGLYSDVFGGFVIK